MIIYLVRHAQSEKNVLNHYNTHKTNLTKEGLRQCSDLFRYFKTKNVDAIFSSDTLRAKQTSNYLKKRLSSPVILNKSLRPINKGILSGKPKSLYYVYLAKSGKDPLTFKPSKGENYSAVYIRAKNFIKLIKSKNYKRIIVLSHSTFLQTLKLALFDKPLDLSVTKDLPNCSIESINISL